MIDLLNFRSGSIIHFRCGGYVTAYPYAESTTRVGLALGHPMGHVNYWSPDGFYQDLARPHPFDIIKIDVPRLTDNEILVEVEKELRASRFECGNLSHGSQMALLKELLNLVTKREIK